MYLSEIQINVEDENDERENGRDMAGYMMLIGMWDLEWVLLTWVFHEIGHRNVLRECGEYYGILLSIFKLCVKGIYVSTNCRNKTK